MHVDQEGLLERHSVDELNCTLHGVVMTNSLLDPFLCFEHCFLESAEREKSE